ncbi:MAG TPA: SUMF1/EgtB/PvdO family nonheme iron enzyme [Caulobacteraceae bacterium]|nr:SUMF1/EgtB/PvdO family nonheme iron enzyme [Caulobacteraceae bacterium]
MVDVFISYKREERARCEHIHEKLKALDLDVWFDVRLTAGKSFDREIEEAVKGAKAVVVLWSPASAESEWVREEAGVGKARNVLAAIRIAPCDLPFGFGTTHVEDIHEAEFADDHPAWLKILDRLGDLMGRPALADYSRAVGHATSLLHRFADRHPTDPLAGKARLLADRLADTVGEGAAPPARPSAALRPLSGPAAGWAEIEASFDPRDYADFLEAYPQSEQAFEARRRKRKLEDWAGTDQADPAAVTAFLRSGAFAALQTVVQATADNLAGAAERSRLLSVPASAKASEARAAAVAKRAVLARSFAIDLPGVPNWPQPVMVAIPPGGFTMGSPHAEERWEGYDGDEEPRHEVTIAHVFALGRGAVTLDAFSAFIAETNHDMGESAHVLNGDKWEDTPGRGWRDPGFAQGGDHPVTCVSWHDAQAFIAWLNERLTLTDRPDAYRLPSEAEWEYACRAGTETPFSFGAAITTDQANFNGTAGYGGVQPSMVWRKATTPVGRIAANAFGLYAMHGDTWDWCEDAWNKTYEGAPADAAPWRTGDVSLRVLRGGSWYASPQFCRSALRYPRYPTVRSSDFGFRLARTLSPPAS